MMEHLVRESGMSIVQIAHLLDRSGEEVRKVVEMKS
ncbi:Predicted protein [Anoxybacillus flavithermus WK1]|uniref:Uncharacterized protein n=1 Tax=Anoxybacillus flavithermus (strain DSM 21510 / WK1) TaxID=491915 RepID=B7GJZ5_ANOFW|nr:Predicted protein [Anoxybacillus flavithermus WK1]